MFAVVEDGLRQPRDLSIPFDRVLEIEPVDGDSGDLSQRSGLGVFLEPFALLIGIGPQLDDFLGVVEADVTEVGRLRLLDLCFRRTDEGKVVSPSIGGDDQVRGEVVALRFDDHMRCRPTEITGGQRAGHPAFRVSQGHAHHDLASLKLDVASAQGCAFDLGLALAKREDDSRALGQNRGLTGGAEALNGLAHLLVRDPGRRRRW